MEMFNVKRKDVHNFDDFMDLKKPGFGGPSSAIELKDGKGKDVNKDRKLKDYQRVVKRDDSFSHEVFNPTYKAMGGDLVHKQEVGKNPYDYKDSYNNMGIPAVNVGKAANEGMCYTDFSSFILESEKIEEDCGCGDSDCPEDCTCKKCNAKRESIA